MNEEFEIVMETGDAFGNEDGKPEKLKSKLKNIQNVKFITDEVIKPKEVKEKPIPKKKDTSDDIISNLIKVYPNVLEDDYCDYLIDRFEKESGLHEEESCFQKVSTERRSFTQLHIMDSNFGIKGADGWSEDSEKIISVFEDIRKQYIEDCKIDKFQLPDEYKWEGLRLKKYEANKIDEFQNHVDILDHSAAKRFLTFFCYLDNNGGGATDFPAYGWRCKMKEKLLFHSPCKKGSVILFPPMWPWLHRGSRPKRKPKYIVQTYLHYV